MFVREKPKIPHFEFEPEPKVVKVENLNPSDFEPAPKVIENTTTLSPNLSDSFEKLTHPTAIDKMLLPASPELEKQKLQEILEAKEKQFLPPGIDKMLLPASQRLETDQAGIPPFMSSDHYQNEKEKELKISEDEKMEQVINLQRLTNFKA